MYTIVEHLYNLYDNIYLIHFGILYYVSYKSIVYYYYYVFITYTIEVQIQIVGGLVVMWEKTGNPGEKPTTEVAPIRES